MFEPLTLNMFPSNLEESSDSTLCMTGGQPAIERFKQKAPVLALAMNL